MVLFYFAVERAPADAKFLGHKREIAIMLGDTGCDGVAFESVKGSLTPYPSPRGEGSR